MQLYAKKSLGQNFLKSKAALSEIVDAAALSASDIVLEVGPGKGVLTEALLEKMSTIKESDGGKGRSDRGKIIAVEKDDRMIGFLQERFSRQISSGMVNIIHGDILDIAPEKIGLPCSKYKIVANIPYYITGQFLRTFLSGNCQPTRMVLLLQKEVAKRIVAREKESILSISVKAYGKPKYINTVQAKYFSPAPKVDSAILLIDNISKEFFKDFHDKNGVIISPESAEEGFFLLVKKGFRHKRKIVAQNLEIPTERRSEIFTKINVSEKIRAEDLSLENWKTLYRLLVPMI